MHKLIGASLAALTLVSAASAETVYNTSLQDVHGTFGTSHAETTTSDTGTVTKVTGAGPNAGANRAQGTAVYESWYQANVGTGTTIGITTDHARSGNGSAFFSSSQGDPGKGDLIYTFGDVANGAATPVALSSLTSVSFDFYRSSTSTTGANLAPVLRFDIAKDGVFAGSLVFENVYQNQTTAPVDTWTTLTGDLTSGIFWATNGSLGPTFASAAGGQKTLADWIAGNTGSTLTVTGLEIGIGSGWGGTFEGAVDNVNVAFASRSIVSNFEVEAVPEPATWAMFIGGFGAIGAAMRRRRSSIRFA